MAPEGAGWDCCLLLVGFSWCHVHLVLLELGSSLSSDREDKMLWELFPCSDWETLEPVCWKGRSECGSAELSECGSHPSPAARWHWGGCYRETEGAHLLGETQAWNKEKTLECLVFGLEMAARAEHPGRGAARLWLPAASTVTESLPGRGMGTLLGSALLLPFSDCHGEHQGGVEGWRRWMGAAGGGWCHPGTGDTWGTYECSGGSGTACACAKRQFCCPMENWGK